MKKKLKIAITGGIGSGKSKACELLKEQGYPVFSCDEINASLLFDENYVKKLQQLFPDCVVKGKVDKKLLANTIFSSEEERKKLEDLAHPAILEKLFTKIEECEETSFSEVPLLLENNLCETFDKIIVIMRKRDSRIQAVAQRDNSAKEVALQKILSQFPYEEAFEQGFFAGNKFILIFNDFSIANLKEQLEEALDKIL